MSRSPDIDGYSLSHDGIWRPHRGVSHREDQYDSRGLHMLLGMQQQHFWYRGRHRFLMRAVERQLGESAADGSLRVIDLGCGSGGWLQYLKTQHHLRFCELAGGDSSELGLQHVSELVGDGVARFHLDLMQLHWDQRWDVVFLLDVIEHLPHDAEALAQVRDALRPHGWLFCTVPAPPIFWSYNDVAA